MESVLKAKVSMTSHSHVGMTHVIYMSHVTHMSAMHRSDVRHTYDLKLYVSFAEYCLFCMALLQKRPIIEGAY